MTQALTVTTTPQPQALQVLFSALREYPDFVDGLSAGQMAYNEVYDFEEIPFTSKELRKEIAETLTRGAYDGFVHDLTSHGSHMDHPYLYLLGFVLSEVNESYTAGGQA